MIIECDGMKGGMTCTFHLHQCCFSAELFTLWLAWFAWGGGGGCLLAYLWCAEWHCDAVKIRFLCMCQCLVCSALAPFHPHSPTFYFFSSPWKSHMGGGGWGGGGLFRVYLHGNMKRKVSDKKSSDGGGGGGGSVIRRLTKGVSQCNFLSVFYQEFHCVTFCQSFIRSSTCNFLSVFHREFHCYFLAVLQATAHYLEVPPLAPAHWSSVPQHRLFPILCYCNRIFVCVCVLGGGGDLACGDQSMSKEKEVLLGYITLLVHACLFLVILVLDFAS